MCPVQARVGLSSNAAFAEICPNPPADGAEAYGGNRHQHFRVWLKEHCGIRGTLFQIKLSTILLLRQNKTDPLLLFEEDWRNAVHSPANIYPLINTVNIDLLVIILIVVCSTFIM